MPEPFSKKAIATVVRHDESAAHPAGTLARVIADASRALDIAEGQPEGHAARTCLIGMRLAREIYLLPAQRSALFYALLLKDLGCSSNASRITGLLGADDLQTKCDLMTTNWTTAQGRIRFVLKHARGQRDTLLSRIGRFMSIVRRGAAAARHIVELRCDRGAAIARNLLMPEATAMAIANLEEHWNGQGHPRGLSGEDIPMLARIAGLAQTFEVFFRRDGLDGALHMAQRRGGTWFDPHLVKVLSALRGDTAFWETLHAADPHDLAARLERPDRAIELTDDHLDRIAAAFAQVIDAKSLWTFRHSEGVAALAEGVARVMGFDAPKIRILRRAALLHDIGKLGISTLILDKPGRLTVEELKAIHKHPYFTRQILSRIDGFKGIASIAAAHHERLDGKGYDRGLDASALPIEARILAICDMFEALASRRPYRQDLTEEEVMGILTRNVGTAIDPACFEALTFFLENSHWAPVELAA